MDIRNVAKNGGTEPTNSRAKRTDARRDVLVPQPPRDEARISGESQKTATAVTNLAERARTAGSSDREAIVAAAAQKLANGELDGEKAIHATAERLFAAKFLTV
ncbi:MAG: hypothetical protein JNK78_03230 [Planctomycetes bacterium]|nr:hypothetical protein [Planctomycetota bacterium]